jgi:ASCH domain
MVALSLRQPWCYAVLSLGKRVENRRWSTDFRGDFLIHASKGMTHAEYYGCLETCTRVLGADAIRTFPPLKSLERGGIVGAAKLVGVIPPCTECTPERPCGKNHGWHFPDQHGFLLENVRPSPRFIPCKGMLGFFKPPQDVLDALRAAARST